MVVIQILDAEISGDSAEAEVEGEDDGREKEKMLFSVIFAANDDTLKEEANLDKISPLAEKKEGKADQRLVKIKIMKQIAFFINPLVYVLYSVIYFIYYLFFF